MSDAAGYRELRQLLTRVRVRIALNAPKATNEVSGISTLTPNDLATSKLLVNYPARDAHTGSWSPK